MKIRFLKSQCLQKMFCVNHHDSSVRLANASDPGFNSSLWRKYCLLKENNSTAKNLYAMRFQ